MTLRLRLYLNRGEGPAWLRLLALVAWTRGGVIEPGTFEGS